MHKKDILFLISLPDDIKAGMKISYTQYISILRSIERIELRESISQNDLAIADQFPLVVIVGHNNGPEESLILENGTLLPWASIISYLPVSCTNTIDIGACKARLGEKSVAEAIKDHCPSIRRVLSPKKSTKVEGRLMLYREMLPSIDLDKDYYEVYCNKVAELKQRIIQLRKREEGQTETLQGTKLGVESSEDVKTSVFAPKEVKATYTFPIQVFLYFDSEKGTLVAKAKAEGIDPDTMPRLIQEPLTNIQTDDMIDVRLTMLDKNKKPTPNILVFYQESTFSMPVKIGEKETPVSFDVEVTEDYLYEVCWAQISIIKPNSVKPCQILSPFKISITIPVDKSHEGSSLEGTRQHNTGGHGNKKAKLAKVDPKKPRETMTLCRRFSVTEDNLAAFFQYLQKQNWIEGNKADFMALFSGRFDKRCELIWKGKYGKGTLVELFKRLKKDGTVVVPKGFTLSRILEGHFKDSDGKFLTCLDHGNGFNPKADGEMQWCVTLMNTTDEDEEEDYEPKLNPYKQLL